MASVETKQLIKDTFIDLLEKQPLSQITVKEIVSECGINRNSFYYHFTDIPSLIEEIILEQTDRIISEHNTFDSMEDCLNLVIRFATDHRKLALHLYNSSSREIFVQYFMQISDHAIRNYLEVLCEGKELSLSDKEIIIHFYKCLIFGQAVDWLRNGMTTGLQEQFHRFSELYKGIPEEIIRRALEQ
ncbi:MAG: TetR/AcrR family transcriptional regulator [Clostridiales bacterium]|nr:TetR/AcrR family transcriptional regulator [Clostridiales bacterium]MBR6483927.1 TetR/AcrR family transcriptional regulator [Clostridiales bacterium]